MATAPSWEAQAAILGPTSSLVRRVEIYNSDGTTRWEDGAFDNRLIGGSVSIDYNRDERRAFSLTLENEDFALEHSPDKFWYDKIIKIYNGVRYVDTSPVISTRTRTNLWTNPSVETNMNNFNGTSVTMTNATDWAANGTKSVKLVPSGGSTDCHVNLGGDSGGVRAPLQLGKTYTVSATVYIPVALSGTVSPRAGKIMVFTKVGAANYVEWPSSVPAASGVTRQKVTFTVPPDATEAFIRLYNGATNSATNAVYWDSVVIEEGTTGGLYYDGDTPDFGNRVYTWSGTANASTSIETTTVSTPSAVNSIWETQVGEFLIDSISEAHFPYSVEVTGRDYTKKCMLSKFAHATAFAAGEKVEDVVKAIALNAGITKFIMPLTGFTFDTEYYFEADTSRWEAMKKIATSFGYELFFDAQGYLVMREFQDPISAPLAFVLETGPLGSLVTYNKTVTDSRIYNHIVVTGESSDSETIVVSAEAFNTEPSSPTNIATLGDRVWRFSSPFVTTVGQAQDLANSYLQIMSLEEFNLDFSSISLPWLEVGEIVQFNDPRKFAGQPTRFLLSTLNLPLDLGAMSGNAKRVSVVG